MEVISGWLIVRNNAFQSAAFFHTSNYYAGKVLAFSDGIYQYLNLRSENQRLAQENALLHAQLLLKKDPGAPDMYKLDSVLAVKHKFIAAKVINNSVWKVKNFLTIDKGTLDGVYPDMGVITANGVVGKVTKNCSEHFATIISVLHVDMLVSASVKKNKVVGSIRWDGNNPSIVRLREIPKDIDVKPGDTIITSQYNSIFPAGILIGKVKKVSARPDETFHDIEVSLATDFQAIQYVYVIDNQLNNEQESVERQNR
jgi:rod shape-determining protein MreC